MESTYVLEMSFAEALKKQTIPSHAAKHDAYIQSDQELKHVIKTASRVKDPVPCLFSPAQQAFLDSNAYMLYDVYFDAMLYLEENGIGHVPDHNGWAKMVLKHTRIVRVQAEQEDDCNDGDFDDA
jgi:hypothetical protein